MAIRSNGTIAKIHRTIVERLGDVVLSAEKL